MENKRLDFELEKRSKIYTEELRLERERLKIQAEKAQIEIDLKKLYKKQEMLEQQTERDEDEADAMMGLRILEKLKEIKRLDEEERRRIVREDELAREKAKLELEILRFEMEERRRTAERQFELERIKQIATLSTEQLISISPAEQGRVLADLKRTEALKDLSEEQILALAAEKSPEVARAFQERYRAMVDGKASEREKELYERLLGDQKGMLDRLQMENEKRVRDINEAHKGAQETAKHAMDNMADIAKSFAEANRGNQPVIITGAQNSGKPQIIYSSGHGDVEKGLAAKICKECGRQVADDAKHCPYCGYEFKGM